MRTGLIVVLVTCGTKKEAVRIANFLLNKNIIACANIVAYAHSIFRWKGKIEASKEVMIFIKARADNFAKIEKAIKRMHSYDVPEIIALPVLAGSKQYVGWVKYNS